jgi:6-pyruvoyltetrahydropterin/6-carboxytetrahydropterin synthase
MTHELVRTYRFEAAHRLPRVSESHPCNAVHGHSYEIEIHIVGDLDPTLGWVLDFADIDRAADPIVAELDHRLLNDIPGLANPTSELLAQWLWKRLESRLPGLSAVAVRETAGSVVVFRGGS